MNLPNKHFQDYPIEFKQIDSIDFPHFEVENKVIIEQNEEGYIKDSLKANLNINTSNTLVINAGVGTGKTTAIISVIKDFYYAKQDYVIFIASPFVSLVEQYFNEVKNIGIPEKHIYRYEYLGEKPDITYLDKKIHIITVNGLLGNPGEDAFINSIAKRDYLNALSKHCKLKNKKVVIVMDEIHDAIKNFKEEYIFNLWKWKEVLHKNIILSATYNEASKIVIEYMAELTDDKIKIIETKRKRISENQSDLFLHYNPAMYYSNSNQQIVDVVNDIIVRDKEIDILCYSKNLAESLIKERTTGASKILYSKYQEINNCTSDLRYNQRLGRLVIQNRYDNSKCNIGTNFKTGVSIKKSNHAFLIIMPPNGSKMPFKNSFGIFSDGINSIIQALARQRERGGEIHIILPPPEKFDYTTLPFNGIKKEEFIKFYDTVKSASKTKEVVKYVPFNLQNMLIRNFYESKLKSNIEKEIEQVENSDRRNKVSLNFPSFKSYLLRRGEEYLANTFKFFGKDLSSYITYNAITNQFVNCNFKGYTSKPPLNFEDNKMQVLFELYFNMYMDEDRFFVYNNTTDFYKYLEFKNDLFTNYKLSYYHNGTFNLIKPEANRKFEIQLLGFVNRKLFKNINIDFYSNNELIDYEYSRSDYFLAGISHAESINLENYPNNVSLRNRVVAFRSLNYFRNKLIENIQSTSSARRGDFQYFFKTAPTDFIAENDPYRFNTMIDYFVNEDYFISNNIFEFKQRFIPRFSTQQKIKSFYTKLIEDFFIVEDDKLNTSPRRQIKAVLETFTIPNSNEVIDLISPADTTFSEEFWKANTYNLVDGNLEKE